MSEVAFGTAKDAEHNIGTFELGLPNGRVVSLNGKIDRLDIAEVDGHKRAIVFDYKLHSRSFGWARFVHCLDMQLPIYMLAVIEAGAAHFIPVGAFYIPVEVGPKTLALDMAEKEAATFARKASGLFDGQFSQILDRLAEKDSRFYNFYVTKDGEPYGSYGNRGALRPDHFAMVLEVAKGMIVKMSEDILSGTISITPYRLGRKSPCSYCDYRAVCRFDWQINDYNILPSLSKTDALEEMERCDGGR